MTRRKVLNILLSVLMLTSMIFGSIGQAQKVAAAPTDPTDESLVPHYFGPYPNWANSPQVLADAIVSITPAPPVPVSIGNALIDRAFTTDSAANVLVVNTHTPLATGTLTAFETWAQAGSGPNTFTAFVLRPTVGITDTYTVVFDSGPLTVPDTAIGLQTFPLATPFPVQTGDLIAHYGQGIPIDIGLGGGLDTVFYPADTLPALDAMINVVAGDATFPLCGAVCSDRTYSIAATITPAFVDPGAGAEAVATVNPVDGSISAITITSPGSGYLVPPVVSIDAAGIVPTVQATAQAEISLGVVTSIAVVETGFGFFTPTVTLTGGNPPPGFEALAQASGGVDFVTLTNGGSGYLVQPLPEFSLPDLPGGVQAQATATMDANGVVTSIDMVNPGSGYTSAPSIRIWDGAVNQLPQAPGSTEATAAASIGVNQIDVISGGQGYDSAPTVTILDFDGTDRYASATATVAVMGAVTAINITNPGAGYLTPGLKKFVDQLPGVCDPAGIVAPVCSGIQTDKYIPFAVPDTTTYPGADYYEIALVQYREKLSSQLPASLLRGYVQLSTGVFPGNQVPLTNANLDPAFAPAPALLPDGSQALGVDYPHYLGPTIVASKDRPVRILFRNLLPTGSGGNLFLPVDTSLMGSGEGPDLITLDANNVPMDMAEDLGSVLDGVRNPFCGERDPVTGEKLSNACFSENRGTLHLHGGITPWISDGTPHQWTTPAGENTLYPRGVSVSNVPDMPDPGPGALTFFYTNQQSARLMFYHDHAWGLTRLNVYAGEAAAYLLTDDMEQSLIAPGGALAGLGVGTPLVIQDKTFLPSAAKVAQQDPTWQYNRWGGEGNLWVPHVYMPAQNPGDPSGMSGFGRWMYGPFFWPPADAKYPPIANPYFDPACDPNIEPFCEPALIPSTPNVSVGMEAFNDTPLVNGAVYPTTSVDPKSYRFRILNAANDRFFNLSWYVADPRTGTLSEVALNPAELAAAQTDPVVFPTPDTAWSPPGPNWIQIGTEGGFLPAPVVIPAQPTTWITDPTRFDVGNVDQHSLLLAPAERADVVVDFSQFRGKTLILYNDAPAAFPARVPGYDYYTGGPDLSPSGAPTTLPGYGPNTRTVMQVKVSNAAPAVAFDRPNTTADRLGALEAAFAHHLDVNGNPAGVFESSVDPIVVGQAVYNEAYGSNFVASGWCNSPTNPTANCDGYARINEQGGDMFKFDTLAGPQISIPLEPKGIHDEMNSANFDPWGRMTANIGLEAPGATPLLQNIILYPYVNPATEVLDFSGMPSALDVTPISVGSDGTQIWKITHNGVDTHPIHFHLFNVQVLNRVAWDNIISPPDANELGWKDTVRINPLQDTYVVMRPIVPVIPFAVPDSVRPLNPMMPLGARGAQNGVNGNEAGFNNTDANGIPIAPIVNEMTNFYWEYVFHCHILSHEEMDMMRPMTVFVARELPDAPVLTFTEGSVILNWTDGTPITADPATWGNPKSEIGYRIERSIGAAPFEVIGTALANQTTFTDPIVVDPNQAYQYRVIAFNAGGESPSNTILIGTLAQPPADPTNLVATLEVGPQVSLTWTDNATDETSYVVERSDNGGPFALIASLGADSAAYVDAPVQPGFTYVYRVYALNAAGPSGYSNLATVVVPAAPAAPTSLTAVAQTSGAGPRVRLIFRDNATNETGFQVFRSDNGGAFFLLTTLPVRAGVGNLTYYDYAVAGGSSYSYYVVTLNGVSPSAPSNTASVTMPAAPLAPSNFRVTSATVTGGGTTARLNFAWDDNSNNEIRFVVQRASDAGFTTNLVVSNRPAGSTTWSLGNLPRGATYYFRIRAEGQFGQSAWVNLTAFPVTTP